MTTCPHGLPHDPARFVRAAGECWSCYRAARGRAKPRRNLFPRPLPCVSLGPKARPDCACADRVCLAGRGVVRRFEQCQTCEQYAPQSS